MFLSGGGRQPLSASPVLFLAAYGQLWITSPYELPVVQRIGNMQRHSTGRNETYRPHPYLGAQWALSSHSWVDGKGRGDGGIVLNCANKFETQLGRKEKSATPRFVIKRERETT